MVRLACLAAADLRVRQTRAILRAMREMQSSIDATIAVTFDLVIQSQEKLRAMLVPGDPWR